MPKASDPMTAYLEREKKAKSRAKKNAVPLDKLCEWLQDNAALTYGAHISAHGWKRELTVWMEEQDAKKET